MSPTSAGINIKRLFAWLAALTGALVCVLVPAAFARSGQRAFPFPGLYFVEIALLGLLVVGFTAARPRLGTRWPALPWAAAGIILAFVILGGFTIGPYLIPAFLGFTITGILADLQAGGAMARHVGMLLLAAVAQGAMIILFALTF